MINYDRGMASLPPAHDHMFCFEVYGRRWEEKGINILDPCCRLLTHMYKLSFRLIVYWFGIYDGGVLYCVVPSSVE